MNDDPNGLDKGRMCSSSPPFLHLFPCLSIFPLLSYNDKCVSVFQNLSVIHLCNAKFISFHNSLSVCNGLNTADSGTKWTKTNCGEMCYFIYTVQLIYIYMYSLINLLWTWIFNIYNTYFIFIFENHYQTTMVYRRHPLKYHL